MTPTPPARPKDTARHFADLARALEDLAGGLRSASEGNGAAPNPVRLLERATALEPKWEEVKACLSWLAHHDGVPITEIAKAMGVTHPTVYAHWEKYGLRSRRRR